ncbi:hypothetical protein [Pseudobythopirellula maris]|nr:hypothetical protein [Pseudobythopirellula maris]
MSREAQQLARLVQSLLRRSGKKGGLPLRWVVALCVLALGYVLLRPTLERSLGVSLPSIVGEAPEFDAPTDDRRSDDRRSGDRRPGDDRSTGESSEAGSVFSASPDELADLAGIFSDEGRGVFESPAGLRYTRGSAHGHRLQHVMAHARDDPQRPGQHGVFASDDPAAVFGLIDEAYELALTGERTENQQEGPRTTYTVDMNRRIGSIGGQSGGRRNHPAARHLRLVVQGDRLITAYPVTP